jgi:hypothetical protein
VAERARRRLHDQKELMRVERAARKFPATAVAGG